MTERADPDRRTLLVDAAVLFVVLPALLVGVHVLVPPDVQVRLELDYADPAPLALWTSAFVHAGDAHLFGNLVGGVGGASVAYLLCVQAGRRRWFYRTLAAFLVVLPVATNLASVAMFASLDLIPPPGRGFSGVAAGFAGFAVVALAAWLRQFYPGGAVQSLQLLVVALLGAEVTWRYGGLDGTSGLLFGLVVLGAAGGLAYRVRAVPTDPADDAVRVGYAVLVVLFVATFVWGLFPVDLVQGGGLVNVFGHLAGLVFGGVVATLSR